jgi:hypothetical protein
VLAMLLIADASSSPLAICAIQDFSVSLLAFSTSFVASASWTYLSEISHSHFPTISVTLARLRHTAYRLTIKGIFFEMHQKTPDTN